MNFSLSLISCQLDTDSFIKFVLLFEHIPNLNRKTCEREDCLQHLFTHS